MADPSDEGNSEEKLDNISDEDPADEEPIEEDPSESDVEEPAVEEEEDPTITTNEVVAMNDKPAAPTITLKEGDKSINSGATVSHAAVITFEIATVNDVTYKYTLDDTKPTTENGEEYTGPVDVTSDTTDEKTVTIQAIAIKAAVGTAGEEGYVPAQESDPATATVTFEAKKKTVKLATDSETGVTVKAGETAIDGTTGMELDPTKDLKLTVVLGESVSATKEIDKLQYKNASSEVTEWTDAAEANGTYTIPKAALETDILVKATLKNMPVLTFALGEKSTYGMFTVNLTVKKGTNVLRNNEELDLTKNNKVSIPSGTVVTATIKAKTKCTLVDVKLGTEAVTLAANKLSATVNVSKANALLADSATITVTASEDYLNAVVAPATANKGTASENKKTWTVEPRYDYIISAKAGGNGDFAIGKAEVAGSVSENDVKLTPITEKDSEEKDVPTGKYKLEVKEPAAGKSYTVKLYKGAEDTTPIDTITIKVLPAITTVTVAKVTGAGKDELSQIIGTEAGYALTLDTNEKTSTDVLKAEIPTGGDPKAFIDHVEVDGNKTLVIITNLVKIEDDVEAQVNIVNESASNKVVKTLTVKPAVLTWDKGSKSAVAPTVKVDSASATDTELKLNMTVPKGVTEEDVYKGECYYVVKATPVAKDENKTDYIEVERYYKATETSMSQVVPVIKADFGKGRSEKFDVTVELRQYIDVESDSETDVTKAPEGTLIATSKPAVVKGAATKEPYYADKITLKKTKAASGIYTGQTESVATIDFGKNTTYNRDGDVTAEVVGQTATAADEKIEPVIKDSVVKLIVGKNVQPGKYNICVTQKVRTGDEEDDYGIPAGAKPTSATLQVTVVRGIKDITLTAQPEIYVSAKGGTAKIAVTYNDGTNETKPKTAKVTYELAAVDASGNVVTNEDSVKKVKAWVTVKDSNGTVTVKKGYKDEIDNNKFAVRAKAADFTGNSATSDYTTFTIRATERTLGDIVIVQADTNDNTKFKPVETKDAKGVFVIKADQLATTYVRVLKAPADSEQPKTEYVEDDFENKAYYDLTLSNKKDVSVNGNFNLSATKVVSNVTVNAVANDGGKKKSPNSGKIKFSITYADVTHADAKLQIKKGTGDGTFADFDKFDANGSSAKQVFTVKASDTANKIGTYLVDYKITVGKGAKIVKAGFPEAQIMMTADTATLNLVGPKGKDGKPQITSYEIKNNVLAGSNKTTAPKITLTKNEKIYAGYKTSQEVEFTIAKGIVKDATKIVISAEQDDASKALFEKLNTKYIDLGEGKLQLSDTDASPITLEFAADVPVTKKAILYFDFVKEDGTALTKAPASVTLKAELLKKSYKLNTKYTMSAKDLAKVPLTNSGKMEGVKDVAFTELLNANIGGKINKFTGTSDGTKNAFELDTTNKKLVLANPDKAINNKQTKENNLTGFVKYTVTYKDGKSDTFTTQITVTMKDSKPVRTLKADKVSVIAVKDQTTTLTVKAGKDGVTLLAAAYENDNKDGDNKAAKEYFKMVDLTDETKAAGMVELKLADLPAKAGVQKGKLTVLIGDSFAADQWSTATDDQKKELLEKYGVTINTQIDVKATTTKNMVKIDSKDTGLNFAKAEESNGKYSQTIAYTQVVSATITGIAADDTLDKNKVPATPTWITMEQAAGNKVKITVDKAGYVAYVKEGAKKNSKGEVTGYPRNGTAVNAAVKFTYANGEAVDSIKIKITPPKLDESLFEAESEDTIVVTVDPATATVKKGETQTFTAEVKINDKADATESAKVAWSVTGASADGTKFEASTLTVDSAETAESLTVTATYTKDGKDYRGTATVTVTSE